MSDHTILGASQEEFNAARVDGEFEARLFLQSLVDHGSAMTCGEAGEAFADTVIEEIRIFTAGVKDRTQAGGVTLGRLAGFLSFFGRVLHEQTAPQRNAIEALFPANKEPAKVIQLSRSDRVKRRPDGEQ